VKARSLPWILPLLLAGACILPAPNLEAYRGKAVDSAESGSSATATAVLTGTTLGRGDLAGPTAVVILQDAEQSAAAARDAFASIQPPDAASDRLRGELLPILSRAAAEIGDMTIVARRGDIPRLLESAKDIEQTTAELQRFATRYD
jgi:hypothetical protein